MTEAKVQPCFEIYHKDGALLFKCEGPHVKISSLALCDNEEPISWHITPESADALIDALTKYRALAFLERERVRNDHQ
jgi:hypothetical protein